MSRGTLFNRHLSRLCGILFDRHLHYDYHWTGALLSVTDKTFGQGNDKTVSYSYYDDGARKSMTTPEGNIYNYHYTALGALHRITVGQNEYLLAEYEYDQLDRRTRLARYSGDAAQTLLAETVYS